MRSKLVLGLYVGLCISGSAAAQTEFTSLASWDSSVSNPSSTSFQINPALSFGGLFQVFGTGPVAMGPASFSATSFGVMYNDGAYGRGVQYFSDDPGFEGRNTVDATITVDFSAAQDVTALAFDLGTQGANSDIDVSVNGSVDAPLVTASLFPTTFFGVTDRAPITSVTFTASTDELDMVGGFETAKVPPAPELDPNSVASSLALLAGGVMLLRGRRPRLPTA